MVTLPRPILLLLTDRTLLSPNWTLAQAIAPAITGGANVVVMREADLPDNPRHSVARFVRDGVRGQVPLLYSGSPEFALEAGGDGILIEDVLESVAAVREVLGPEKIIGVAIQSRDAALRARDEGADFLLAAWNWSDSDAALTGVRILAAAVEIPLIAGVDMNPGLAARCMEEGAAGIAICAPAMSAYNRTETVRAYRLALNG